jgi:SAM-dependent methyltransferase
MPTRTGSVSHPVFARVYARLSPGADRRGTAEHRRELLAGLDGSVLELGCGNGLNFAHYPDQVTDVLALEPEPYLCALARAAADRAAVPVTVLDAVGEALPAADGLFDHAVTALVLCSVGDPARVLAELHRVIRSGGTLRYYEHVISEHRIGSLVDRMLDATVWPQIAGGCHLSRDTGSLIRAAGFEVASERRIPAAAGRVAPPIPHLLGVATRP